MTTLVELLREAAEYVKKTSSGLESDMLVDSLEYRAKQIEGKTSPIPDVISAKKNLLNLIMARGYHDNGNEERDDLIKAFLDFESTARSAGLRDGG